MSADRVAALAEVIWETSRRDEGTISATGADIIAKALLASPALRDLLAETWDEGASATTENQARQMYEDGPQAANPYRADREQP